MAAGEMVDHRGALSRLRRTMSESVDAADVSRRAWIVGAASLTDLDPAAPLPDLDFMRAVLDFLRERGVFPGGALKFIPEQEVERRPESDVAGVTYRKSDGAGGEWLEVRGGFAPGHRLTTAMTRSGLLGPGERRPSHVLLSDVEAACTDLLVLSGAASLLADYTGPVDLAVTIAAEVPGEPLALRRLDEHTGEVQRVTQATPSSFDMVHARFHMDSPLEVRYTAAYEMAVRAGAQFGASRVQYIDTPEDVPYEDFEIWIAEGKAMRVPDPSLDRV